jgi:hypothetical protein
MAESVNTHRSWGTITPDTTWTVGSINCRFEIPLGITYDMMVVMAQPHVQKTIADFERLGDGQGHKWRFYDKIPIQYKVSNIGLSRNSLDKMNAAKVPTIGQRSGLVAQQQGSMPEGKVAMVAEIFFVRPEILVNADEEREMRESLNERDGFVPLNEVDQLKETLGNAEWRHPDKRSESS